MGDDVLVFYISPDGSDNWSGGIPDPAADRRDGPFATLDRARQAARCTDSSGRGMVRVVLREGTYRLTEPLRLEPDDGGTADRPVCWEAYPGEQPVISAGMIVSGWAETRFGGLRAWTAPAPGHEFHNLWVNDERRLRPRFPRQGLLRTVAASPGDFYEGTREFRVSPGEIPSFSRPDDVELVYFAVWTESRLPVESIDREAGIVRTRLRSAMNASALSFSSTYYWDNVREELGEPGRWYLDRTAGTLTYLPYEGETLENTRIVVPRLVHAVEVTGTADRPVSHVRFTGVTFAHTEWRRTGKTQIFRWDIRKLEPVSERDVRVLTMADDKAADHQAAVSCEAALDFIWVRDCVVEGCTVRNTGSYGISLGIGCRGNLISRSAVYGHGGGGIKIGTQQMEQEGAAAFNTVADCEIRDCAQVYHSAVGVWIGQSPHNRVVHCSIHDLSYTGISVGWTWGYGPSGAYCNTIEHNLIYNIAVDGWMHDLGGIYMLGISPGTVVRNNIIRNVGKDNNVVGVYTDEGSSYIRWENNLVVSADSTYLHHYGKNNIVVNNIFADYRHGLVVGKDERPAVSLLVERNIFYSGHGEVFRGWQGGAGCVFRDNLYWCPAGVTFDGKDLDAWRAAVDDTGSTAADPMFTNPEAGNYTLAPNSPALALGFVPFDLSGVGPRGVPGAAGGT